MQVTPKAKKRAAVAGVVLVILGPAGASLLWNAHETGANQAAQRRTGEIVERKLCSTLDQLAALKPPGGNAAANPSRAYEQQLHATLSQLAADVGCPGGTHD